MTSSRFSASSRCSGFLNRWNDSMATPLEAHGHEAAARLLADTGWEVGKHG
jgi:hypothetical protein